MSWLLGELLGMQQAPAWLPAGQGRVLLIDATRDTPPGGTGDDVRLHQSYDRRAGRMDQVQLTDRHAVEGLGHFALHAGDLAVCDAGYPVASSVELSKPRQSELLLRTTASHLHLEDEQGQTIEPPSPHQAGASQLPQRTARLGALAAEWRAGRAAGALLSLPPSEQAKLARERKAAKLRQKQGPKYNQELVWWAGWVIGVSTADRAMWSGRDLVRLYRARWQIELLFKRLKQCLQLHQVRLKDWQRGSSVLQLCLIGWCLQEQEAEYLRELLSGLLQPQAEEIGDWRQSKQDEGEQEAGSWILSSWTPAQVCCEQVRTMLRGAWSQRRLQQCLPLLQRYLCSRPRKRGHCETEQRAWLQARAIQRAGRLRA